MVQRVSSAKSSSSAFKNGPLVYPVETRKNLPSNIRCGICKDKFTSLEACVEHMKNHFWARSAPNSARSISSMPRLNSARVLKPPSGPAGMASSPRMGMPAGTPTPRSPVSVPPQPTQRPHTAHAAKKPSPNVDHNMPLPLQRCLSQPVGGRSRQKQLNKLLTKAGVAMLSPPDVPLPPEPLPKAVPRGYTCYYCQGSFLDAITLMRHSRTHGNRAPYSCSRCGRMFALYSSLVNHERSHDPDGGAMPFHCRRCPAVFLHEALLKAHVRRHDDGKTGPDSKPYQCHTCQEWISNEGSLRIHMQRHGQFDTPRICARCGTGFSSDAFLRAHHKLHEGEAKTRCVICIRPFQRSRVLLRHSDVHADDRHNVCDVCEKRFPKVGDGPVTWRRMQLLIPDDRRFRCLYCGVAFSRLNQLAAHEAGHTDLAGSTPAIQPSSKSALGVLIAPQPLLPQHLRPTTIVVN